MKLLLISILAACSVFAADPPKPQPTRPKAPELDIDLQMELVFAESEMLAARQQADQDVKDVQKRGEANVAAKQAALDAVYRKAQQACGPGRQPLKEDVTDEATKATKKRVVCDFAQPRSN